MRITSFKLIISFGCLALAILAEADLKSSLTSSEMLTQFKRKLDSYDRCQLPSIVEVNEVYDFFKELKEDEKNEIEAAEFLDHDVYPWKLIKWSVLQDWDHVRLKMNPSVMLRSAIDRQMMKLVESYQQARFGQSSCVGSAQYTGDILSGLPPDYFQTRPNTLTSAIAEVAGAEEQINDLLTSLRNVKDKLENRERCELPTLVELDKAYESFNKLNEAQKDKIEHANWLDGNLYPLKMIIDAFLRDWESYRAKMNPNIKLRAVIDRQMINLAEKYQLNRFGGSSCSSSSRFHGDILGGLEPNNFVSDQNSLASAIQIAAS